MKINIGKEQKRRFMEIAFFGLVMGLTLYQVFNGQDIVKIMESVKQLPGWCLAGSVLLAVFFVSAEGAMIYYLLHSLNGKSGLFRCISYSFVGFFYSAITPSATGGQPMQLYYMKKDKNRLSDSSVVLMMVAMMYKFILVLVGVFLLLFWRQPLKLYLNSYFGLYLLGLMLNVILVVLLICVMVMPELMKKILVRGEIFLEKIRILKPASGERRCVQFIDGYKSAVLYLKQNKGKILVIMGMTFLQRGSMFLLTYLVYRGFGLQGTDGATVVFLQAAIYVAVDMLPIPGAQGITEMMYKKVFQRVFPAVYLPASMYVTRGISFYLLLFISLVFAMGNHFYRKSSKNQKQNS